MDLLSLLVTIIVIGLVFYLLWWLIGVIGLPEPFSKVATVVLVLITVIVLIGLLTGSITMPSFRWRG